MRVMLLIAFSALLTPAAVLAQGAPFSGPGVVSLSPAAQDIERGTNFTVDVFVDLTGVNGTCGAGTTPAVLGGFTIPVDFDNTQVNYVGAAGCPTAPPQFAGSPTATDPAVANPRGELAIVDSQTGQTGPTGLICVARLIFTVRADATHGVPSTVAPDCVGTYSSFGIVAQYLVACGSGAVSIPANCVPSSVTPIDVCAGETELPVVTPPFSIALTDSACLGSDPGARGSSSASLAAFIGGGSATDVCDATPTRLPAQVGGADIDDSTFFPIGTTTVTFRFVDDAGNIGSASAEVTVDLLHGDLDEDALITATDLVTLANNLVGNVRQGRPPFSAPLEAADVNDSDSVDALDLVHLANFLVGNTACLLQ